MWMHFKRGVDAVRDFGASFTTAGLGAALMFVISTSALAGTSTVTLTAAGQTDAIPINGQKNLGVGILVNVPSGVTFSGKVEMAGSKYGPWNDHDTLINLTASANGNLAFPIGVVRLNGTTVSGGIVTLTVIQPDN